MASGSIGRLVGDIIWDILSWIPMEVYIVIGIIIFYYVIAHLQTDINRRYESNMQNGTTDGAADDIRD